MSLAKIGSSAHRAAEQHREEIERDHAEDRLGAPHVHEPGEQLARRARTPERSIARRRIASEATAATAMSARSTTYTTAAPPVAAISAPAANRPGNRGELVEARVPRDRAAQLLAREQLREQGVARRPVEHLRRAESRRREVDPAHRRARQGRGGEYRGGCGPDREPRDHHAAPIEPVGEVTGRQKEQDHRQELREADPAERERRSGALVEIPPDRDALRALDQRGGEVLDGIEPVVPRPEESEYVGAGH